MDAQIIIGATIIGIITALALVTVIPWSKQGHAST